MRDESVNLRMMELLYEKFYTRLYLYAHAFLADSEEAKDIVGDVFQTVWERWEEESRGGDDASEPFAPTASFLYTLVRNRCLDFLRHARASERYTTMLRATSDFATDDEVEEFEQRIASLREAVGRLPDSTQRVLREIYFKKHTYREAAQRLSMSENMVHKHMVKAFRLLREEVGCEALSLLLFACW